MPVSLNIPLSLFSIPVAWYTAMYPAIIKVVIIEKTIGYDNLRPRANTQRVIEDFGVPCEVVEHVQRLEGAHKNGNETLPLWVGAVLAGNLARLPNRIMNITAIGFVITRLLYNHVYLTQSSVRDAGIRTILYYTSIGFPMYLFIKAGNVLKRTA